MIKTNDLMLSMNVPRLFPSLQDWRLHGTLMVHLTEHTAPIVQLSVPNDDHGFFFSCSNDGTVKLWALHRLFKNWSTKSSLTYTMQGKVTCIASVSPTYFACGSNQNVVHVVEIQAKGIRVLHVLNFEGVEIPLFLRFFQTDASALLIVITSASFIYGYSSGDCIFKLTCPLAYGVISSVLVDYNSHWLLIGTSRGLLLLFDLRLHLLISKWMHPSRSHIHQLCCHPILEDHVIISTGKNEVSIWNLVSSQFTHVLCRQLPTIPYEPLSIPRPKDFIQSALRAFEESPSWEGYYSMYAPRGSPYVILAGTDRKIRIWKFMEKQVSILCHEDEENGDWGFSHQQHDSISFLIETPPSASKKNKGIIGFTLKESKQSVHHLDTITDLHVLHASFPILVTCSRDTTIKLWK
ncbi:phosphoinositide-3-kinase, regulatory subunit 4 [Coelomomyces lativittatus]|nr:phosphoinositide-3-kinase, regulatory subunit 4 [Coelomomyces lativittatus]